MGVVDTDLLLVHRLFRWIPEDLWDSEQRAYIKALRNHQFGPFAKVKYLHRGQLNKRWLSSNWLLVSNQNDLILVTLQYQNDLFSRGLVFFHGDLPDAAVFCEAAVLFVSALFLKMKFDRVDVLTPAPHSFTSLTLEPKTWHAPVSWDAAPGGDEWLEQTMYTVTQSSWWKLPEAMIAHEQLSYLVKRIKNKENMVELKQKRAIKKRPRGLRSLFRF